MLERQRRIFIVTFLAPALIIFTILVAFPSLWALGLSLQKWDGIGEMRWVGLDNFASLFSLADPFPYALWHNTFLVVVGGAIVTLLALMFAGLIHRGVRGAALFRVTFFFPNVVASVAVALLWVLLYSTTEFGLINGVLTGLDILEEPYPFAATENMMWALIPVLAWMMTGFYMVLYLAAMQSIPEEYYEAALLDGAGGVQQFWHVTLPLIREVLVVGVVFLIISVLKIFDIVWVMENQWPSRDSHVMATLIYQKVFTEYNVGYGAAVSVILFVLVFCATLVTLRFSRREALEF
jgi:ABC-type sugar transport system permease subunit